MPIRMLSRTDPASVCVIRLLLALILLGAGACAQDGARWDPDDYTVKSGDTLYSIAWRYELDPDALARWNGLSDPGKIRAGQRLHLKAPAHPPPSRPAPVERVHGQGRHAPAQQADKTRVTVQKGDTLYGLSRRLGIPAADLARYNRLKSPYLLKPGQVLVLRPPKSTPAGGQKSHPDARHGTPRHGAPAHVWPERIRWQWPVKGKVVKTFRRNRLDRKGIDIAGKPGQTVRAAAPGKVVYSGNGLISYGNLVIIKHNRHYLSAYAYNHKLLVKEGEWVRAGQPIAEMGRKPPGGARLHFEVRKDGKPVNPLAYLPG